MWVEELSLENIKSFEKVNLRFGTAEKPHLWINLLGENGGGKSTILQALGLLLAGPESAPQLLRRPDGWLRDENSVGKISIRIHKDGVDANKFGIDRERNVFGYTFFITGSKRLTIRNKVYLEPAIVENTDKILTWLRQNALISKGEGWFSAGYGAFRRLTRVSQILVPSLKTPFRYTNFSTLFDENEPLSAFEQWMVYLDFKIIKDSDKQAVRQKELGIQAINQLLPEGCQFDSVSSDGKIWFDIEGQKVPTISLSDGFRSILALAGDLVWRLIEAYPNSNAPLKEPGVVLIDELDIHLHPIWQRTIANSLRQTFPRIQFIMATHSPLVAAGAGEDAITYRLKQDNGKSHWKKIDNISTQSVDKVLTSEAFELGSTFSPTTQGMIDKYYLYKRREATGNLSLKEKKELELILSHVNKSLSPQLSLVDKELQEDMDAYILQSFSSL